MSKEKVIVHINNVSKIIGLKRIKLSQGTIIHIQNELFLALEELKGQNIMEEKKDNAKEVLLDLVKKNNLEILKIECRIVTGKQIGRAHV